MFLVMFASWASAQQVQIQDIGGFPSPWLITRLKVSSDGRLWAFGGTNASGALTVQQVVSPTAPLQVINGNFKDNNAFPFNGISFGATTPILSLGGFYPESGTTASFSPTTYTRNSAVKVTGVTNSLVQASLQSGVPEVCGSFRLPTGSLKSNQYGAYPSADGTKYFVDNDGTISSIYLLGKSNGGVCDLTEVAKLTVPISEAWKQADGSFIVRVILAIDPVNGVSSEIAIARDGVLSTLYSGKTEKCCGLEVDWFNDQKLLLHGTNSVGVYKSGAFSQIYDNSDGFGTNAASVLGLSKKYALISTSSAPGAKLMLIDVETKQRWVLASTGQTLPGGFTFKIAGQAVATVSDKGVVYFSQTDPTGKFSKVYSAVIAFPPVVNSFTIDSTEITSGECTIARWNTLNTTTVQIDQGVGNVELSGTTTVCPTTTTPYTLTATGPGGIDSRTVTVKVTPKVVLPPAPTIFTGGVRNAASGDESLSPGMFAAIYGQNLGESTSEVKTLPLPTSFLGVEVRVNGVRVPLLYVSPRQINFQFPFDVSLGTATVQVVYNGTLGNSVQVTILSTSPGVFPNGDLGIVTDSNYQLITADNPLVLGTHNTLWVTGLGRTSNCPELKAGVAPGKVCYTTIQPTLIIGGRQATEVVAVLSPEFPGLYQVNFVVPGPSAIDPEPTRVEGTVGSDNSQQARFQTMSQQLVN
ncbi:MAG: hypothetical protein V4473_00280 [Patescibacteria group bacterium]